MSRKNASPTTRNYIVFKIKTVSNQNQKIKYSKEIENKKFATSHLLGRTYADLLFFMNYHERDLNEIIKRVFENHQACIEKIKGTRQG